MIETNNTFNTTLQQLTIKRSLEDKSTANLNAFSNFLFFNSLKKNRRDSKQTELWNSSNIGSLILLAKKLPRADSINSKMKTLI